MRRKTGNEVASQYTEDQQSTKTKVKQQTRKREDKSNANKYKALDRTQMESLTGQSSRVGGK